MHALKCRKPFSVSRSLLIDTPQKYEQLKSGQFSSGYPWIYVTAAAHPNILTEPKHFWNATHQSLHFDDGHGNAISLAPLKRKLVAIFSTGGNLALGFPDNYKEYQIHHYNQSITTGADLDYMMQWRDAERIAIFDKSGVARQISQRVHDMQPLKNLEQLEFSINPSDRLNVRLLLEELRKLRSVIFHGIAMTEEQLDAFVNAQDVADLDEWDEYCLQEPKEIHYYKRTQ